MCLRHVAAVELIIIYKIIAMLSKISRGIQKGSQIAAQVSRVIPGSRTRPKSLAAVVSVSESAKSTFLLVRGCRQLWLCKEHDHRCQVI